MFAQMPGPPGSFGWYKSQHDPLLQNPGGGMSKIVEWFVKFHELNPKHSAVSKASLYTCEQNLILHILTKFHDDVIHTKIIAISSTSTSGIFTVFSYSERLYLAIALFLSFLIFFLKSQEIFSISDRVFKTIKHYGGHFVINWYHNVSFWKKVNLPCSNHLAPLIVFSRSKSLTFFPTFKNGLNSDYFAKNAHKIVKLKYFPKILNDFDSPINSLSNDM